VFRALLALSLSAIGIFIIDQNIKTLFIDGYRYYGEYIDLILVYNTGVAFSMLSVLGEWLKWIQMVIVVALLIFIFRLRKVCFMIPVGLLTGAALSNIYDRFIHEGVVDYVSWHYGFNFAVFNFADVTINIAVAWLLLLNFKPSLCKSKF